MHVFALRPAQLSVQAGGVAGRRAAPVAPQPTHRDICLGLRHAAFSGTCRRRRASQCVRHPSSQSPASCTTPRQAQVCTWECLAHSTAQRPAPTHAAPAPVPPDLSSSRSAATLCARPALWCSPCQQKVGGWVDGRVGGWGRSRTGCNTRRTACMCAGWCMQPCSNACHHTIMLCCTGHPTVFCASSAMMRRTRSPAGREAIKKSMQLSYTVQRLGHSSYRDFACLQSATPGSAAAAQLLGVAPACTMHPLNSLSCLSPAPVLMREAPPGGMLLALAGPAGRRQPCFLDTPGSVPLSTRHNSH